MQSVAQETTDQVSASRRELTALVAECGVYRPDHSLFSLSGRDRVRWLNGMVSNNVRDLAAGRGVYAFVLNPQGHILGDLYVFNRGDSFILEIERVQAEAILQIFKRYIIMDKVEIEDLSGKNAVVGITGPKSGQVLASLGFSSSQEPLTFTETSFNGIQVIVVRGDNPYVPSYELFVPADKVDSVWNQLIQAGTEKVSAETLETFRILCGIPKVGKDIRERTLPHETGQERALNFNKGCYIGQEIVERIRARGAVHKIFVGFELQDPFPAPGTKIESAGREVGEITSVMAAPLQGKRLGLGYLRKEVLDSNALLRAGDAEVKPVSLPQLSLLHPSNA